MPPLAERINNPITITDTQSGESRTVKPLFERVNKIASEAGAVASKAGGALADRINDLAIRGPLGKVAGISVVDNPTPNKFTRKYGDEDRKVILGTLFGEISNRTSDKQDLEARTILNVARNRAKKNGTTIVEELKKPMQFQAYGGKEYNRYVSGKVRKTDEQKIAAITKALMDLEEGNLQDNVDGSEFYIHKPDGSILATPEYLYGKQSTGPVSMRR